MPVGNGGLFSVASEQSQKTFDESRRIDADDLHIFLLYLMPLLKARQSARLFYHGMTASLGLSQKKSRSPRLGSFAMPDRNNARLVRIIPVRHPYESTSYLHGFDRRRGILRLENGTPRHDDCRSRLLAKLYVGRRNAAVQLNVV